MVSASNGNLAWMGREAQSSRARCSNWENAVKNDQPDLILVVDRGLGAKMTIPEGETVAPILIKARKDAGTNLRTSCVSALPISSPASRRGESSTNQVEQQSTPTLDIWCSRSFSAATGKRDSSLCWTAALRPCAGWTEDLPRPVSKSGFYGARHAARGVATVRSRIKDNPKEKATIGRHCGVRGWLKVSWIRAAQRRE